MVTAFSAVSSFFFCSGVLCDKCRSIIVSKFLEPASTNQCVHQRQEVLPRTYSLASKLRAYPHGANQPTIVCPFSFFFLQIISCNCCVFVKNNCDKTMNTSQYECKLPESSRWIVNTDDLRSCRSNMLHINVPKRNTGSSCFFLTVVLHYIDNRAELFIPFYCDFKDASPCLTTFIVLSCISSPH